MRTSARLAVIAVFCLGLMASDPNPVEAYLFPVGAWYPCQLLHEQEWWCSPDDPIEYVLVIVPGKGNETGATYDWSVTASSANGLVSYSGTTTDLDVYLETSVALVDPVLSVRKSR